MAGRSWGQGVALGPWHEELGPVPFKVRCWYLLCCRHQGAGLMRERVLFVQTSS